MGIDFFNYKFESLTSNQLIHSGPVKGILQQVVERQLVEYDLKRQLVERQVVE